MNVREKEMDTLLNEPFRILTLNAKSIITNLQNLTHVMPTFESNESIIFMKQKRLSNAVVEGMVVNGVSRKHLKSMGQEIRNNFEADVGTIYKPKRGDMVACCEAFRGLIIHEPTLLCNTYKVFVIDFGYVAHCKEVIRLSAYFQDAPFCAVTCIFNISTKSQSDSLDKLLKNQKFQCTLTSVSAKSCSGLMFESAAKPNPKFDVEFYPYVPKIDMFGLPPLLLQSPLVKIASFITARNCYLRAGDEDSEERRLRLLDSVNYNSLKSKRLTDRPFVGDIVAAPYRNSYWRAVVENADDTNCLVDLVDKGLQITVAIVSLKELPDFLKMPNRTTQKITLANVRIIEKNRRLQEFLDQDGVFKLVLNAENEVILKFVENDNSVQLQSDLNRHETVNDHIHRLLQPDWLILLKSGRSFDPPKFTFTVITSNEWPVGSFISLNIIDKVVGGEVLSVINTENEAQKIYTEMNVHERIQEYVSYFDDETATYVPNTNEICISRKSKNDKWERAVCLMRGEITRKFLMFLLDSGSFVNVWHVDIRRINGEFLKYPVGFKIAEVENPDNLDISKLVDLNDLMCEIVEDSVLFCMIRIPNLKELCA